MKDNQVEIREALAEYKEAKSQNVSWSSDSQILSLLEITNDTLKNGINPESAIITAEGELFVCKEEKEAHDLIKYRYPKGSGSYLVRTEFNLIEAMMNELPYNVFQGATHADIFSDKNLFNELVSIAEQV